MWSSISIQARGDLLAIARGIANVEVHRIIKKDEQIRNV
ncbi:hypothetical protein Poly51_16590 [Rubripirellula tenax]|uniref:Uncharacterized protein n=1 Tax=Rubripirellula tenax TaxID=2528015 RepID=A0A5C6FGT7_9BACT|nr:hypothetical protein Poly51_16590 [Rubripirellula tenax]